MIRTGCRCETTEGCLTPVDEVFLQLRSQYFNNKAIFPGLFSNKGTAATLVKLSLKISESFTELQHFAMEATSLFCLFTKKCKTTQKQERGISMCTLLCLIFFFFYHSEWKKMFGVMLKQFPTLHLLNFTNSRELRSPPLPQGVHSIFLLFFSFLFFSFFLSQFCGVPFWIKLKLCGCSIAAYPGGP